MIPSRFALPIGWRLLLIIAIAGVLVTASVILGLAATRQVTATAERIASVHFADYQACAAISARITGLNGELYKVINALHAGEDAKTVAARQKAADQEMEAIARELDTLRPRFPAAAEQEAAAAAGTLLGAYRAAVRNAWEVCAADVSVGAMSMLGAEDTYRQLGTQVGRLMEAARRDADAAIAASRTERRQVQIWILAVSGAGGLAGFAASLLVARSITRPVARCAAFAAAVRDGAYDRRLPAGGGDELGTLANALNAMAEGLEQRAAAERAAAEERRRADQERSAAERDRSSAERDRERARALVAVLDAATNGDLTRAVPATGEDDPIGLIARGLDRLLAQLRQHMRTIGGEGAQVVAHVGTIAGHAERALALGHDAGEASGSAGASIARLAGTCERIAATTRTIGTIAHQTNILALNAAVKASQAGTAGASFSVVAGEVKALAEKTTRCADEIAALAQDIRAGAGDAQERMTRIAAVIADIDASQRGISSTLRSGSGDDLSGVAAHLGRVVSSFRL